MDAVCSLTARLLSAELGLYRDVVLQTLSKLDKS